MKKNLLVSAIFLISSSASATSYVVGNLQFHSNASGSNTTSKLEAGHIFNTPIGGLTAFVEYSGVEVGTYDDGKKPSPAWVTIGLEQAYKVTDSFWIAGGYHNVLYEGKTVQYRPLIKMGYSFDSGFALSNRTRWHIDASNSSHDLIETRFDNNVSYTFTNIPIRVHYNNVYYIKKDTSDSYDHEIRIQWMRDGVKPYIENRSQRHGADGVKTNNAVVLGAFYAF